MTTYTRTQLTEMFLAEIREARENASTPEDFRIARRLIEERYEVLFANAQD